jgi:multicomponent Na+:H+ antiporter subunit G
VTITDGFQYLGAVLMVVGALFGAIAGLGVLRLPDLFTRMHSASKAGAVGAGLVLLAIAIVGFDASIALRAVLGILFLLLTTPLSAHLLARAAYHAGIRPLTNASLNEMETVTDSKSP